MKTLCLAFGLGVALLVASVNVLASQAADEPQGEVPTEDHLLYDSAFSDCRILFYKVTETSDKDFYAVQVKLRRKAGVGDYFACSFTLWARDIRFSEIGDFTPESGFAGGNTTLTIHPLGVSFTDHSDSPGDWFHSRTEVVDTINGWVGHNLTIELLFRDFCWQTLSIQTEFWVKHNEPAVFEITPAFQPATGGCMIKRTATDTESETAVLILNKY